MPTEKPTSSSATRSLGGAPGETRSLGGAPGETPSLGGAPGETPSLGGAPGETPSLGGPPGETRSLGGAPSEVKSQSNWRVALRALRHRNYRLFFTGQGLSLIGTWMTQLATSWLVYRLTRSAFLLGFVGFSGQLPALLLAPFAGVWVDRWNRHRVLKTTQTLSMLESFALAALAFPHKLFVWEIIALNMFQGAVNAFDMPARQSFMIEMVGDREDLANAIALNSSMVNGARLIGPSIAGILIAIAGEAWCFLIDGFSYLAVIGSLFAMRIAVRERPVVTKHVFTELKEGWNYATRFSPIRSILTVMAVVSLVGYPYTVLLPIFAAKVLHGGAHTLGFLTAAAGIGATVSGIHLAMRKSVVGMGRMIPISAAFFGGGLIAFGLSRVLWLSLLLMLVTGFSMMRQLAVSNTILQTIVEEDKRGRVMSFYTMAFIGTAPFGSLLAGSLADRMGAPLTLVLGGVICIAVAIWFATRLPAIRKLIHPIYVELGIIPEVASGIQSAAALRTPPESS